MARLTFFIYIIICCPSFAYELPFQERYQLYCMYTPDFEDLFTTSFLPSLKDNFDLVVKQYPQECATGTFRSEGWDRTMLNKLELIQEAILENWGNRIFFYSDIDIVFLKPILELSLELLGDNDLAAQQSWPRDKLCAGFIVMRGNTRTLEIVNTAYTLLSQKEYPDDQLALQAALSNSDGEIAWRLLPSKLYPNGRKVLKNADSYYSKGSEIELDSSMVLFHANCCIGLEDKLHFLGRVQEEFLQSFQK